jgi:hypothetical protein
VQFRPLGNPPATTCAWTGFSAQGCDAKLHPVCDPDADQNGE